MTNELVFDIETTGLRPLENKIICICGKIINGNTITIVLNDERKMIMEFITWIKENNVSKIITANGKDFDLPFIFIRSYISGIEYHLIKFMKKLNHFDIINDITDKRISLNNLSKLYGCDPKINDGLGAIELYHQKKFDNLIDYCMSDVYITRDIYLKYLKITNEKNY